MTPAIRCLVLLTACSALNACSDVKSPAPLSRGEQQEGAAAHSERPKPESKIMMPPPALTAAAPAAPASVADVQVMPKPEQPKPESSEDAESAKVLPDFERPLDPSEVKVVRLVLATDVQGREPLGESEQLTTDTKKIFAFVELSNDKPPYAFRVHWEKLGEPASPYGVKLDVPTAPRFRTWSWTAIRREPGSYRVVLRTLSGEEITSREFELEAGIEQLTER